MTDILTNRDIKLRALEPEDLEELFRWENNPDTWHLSNTLTPLSRFVLRQYLENAHRDIYETRQLRLVIQLREEERPLGAIDLFDFDPFHHRAGVGILIADRQDRNRGYAGQALETLVNYGFEVLRLHQLYANIGVTNQVSIKLFEKAGFEITGRKRDWIRVAGGYEDEYIVQRVRSSTHRSSGA